MVSQERERASARTIILLIDQSIFLLNVNGIVDCVYALSLSNETIHLHIIHLRNVQNVERNARIKNNHTLCIGLRNRVRNSSFDGFSSLVYQLTHDNAHIEIVLLFFG